MLILYAYFFFAVDPRVYAYTKPPCCAGSLSVCLYKSKNGQNLYAYTTGGVGTQTVPGHLGRCCPDCPRRVWGIPDSTRQSVQSKLSQRVGPAPTVQERRPFPRESWDTRGLHPSVLGQSGKMHPLQHSRELLDSRLFRTLGASPDCPSTVVTVKKTLS